MVATYMILANTLVAEKIANYDPTKVLLKSHKIKVNNTNTCILPDTQKFLLTKGFLVSCIRPPTVPMKSARIRISLSCHHTKQQIIEMLGHLEECLC